MVIKPSDSIARAKLYELDQENELVKKLIRIRNEISDYFIEQELKRQGYAISKASEKTKQMEGVALKA